MVKLAKAEAENAKVGVRNARKEANNELKKTEFLEDQLGNAEVDVQTLTDDYIKKIDGKYASKEDEIRRSENRNTSSIAMIKWVKTRFWSSVASLILRNRVFCILLIVATTVFWVAVEEHTL